MANLLRACALLVAWISGAVVLAHPRATASSWMSMPDHLADGVDYFTSTDASLVDPPAPTSVFLLKLDPSRVQLASVHAHDEIMGLETVESLATRHGAVAAINGGYFNASNGEPVSVLKEHGELVSDAAAPRGAVIIHAPPRGKTELDFDQLAVRMKLVFMAAGRDVVVPIDGVDTTRARGKLMLYTPSYHADTDTAPSGIEWIVAGQPMRVSAIRRGAGHTPIPKDGVVLSFGGLAPAEPLASLTPGTRVDFKTEWKALQGTPARRMDSADSIVNGAGLLRSHGVVMTAWDQSESLSVSGFITIRNPRTLIGLDRAGAIWMAVVDGRQPASAVGMQFSDLERLCDRLQLTDALNLDGGGSSTMVVRGRMVNHPSDPLGSRTVGDAITVTLRPR